MVQTATNLLSLADYLAIDDPDRRCEVENGVIRYMPPESELNRRIAVQLLIYFSQLGIAPERLTMKTEIIVTSDLVTARAPDFMILSEELAIALQGASSSIVTHDLPRPDLAVEIVSPGKENRDRDYRYKRSEYATCRIPEYWIVDPERGCVLVLEWVDGFYEVTEFSGEANIVSPRFGALDLRVDRVITAQS
ncbi:MAG: Uma2 family endonuclease [Geitlerinemataceae cyanobacterium]